VAKLKLQYFGHITRGSAGQLALTVLEGIMEGLRHQGRPRRQWTGCEYIQLKEMSQDRAQWRSKISEWSSAVANPHRGRSTSESVIAPCKFFPLGAFGGISSPHFYFGTPSVSLQLIK